MSAMDDPRTLGRTRLSFANEGEIDEFVAMLDRFERGELPPDRWRTFRLTRGTYGQRQTGDVQMLRAKIPQGILTAAQLHALADIAECYSRGFGHITTRQNMQFHFMKLHDVELAMRRLAEAGLTSREACGSAVRNITACPYAGVAHDEAFDVTPYAEALTRHLLRHPLASSLPRKFKIAFEGCVEDHAMTVDQRHRLPRPHRPGRWGGRERLPCDGWRRHLDHVQERRPPVRLLARRRDPGGCRSHHPGLSPVRRLRAQAAQPHEVSDQDPRLGRVAGGVRARASRASRGRRAWARVSIPIEHPSKPPLTGRCGRRPRRRRWPRGPSRLA